MKDKLTEFLNANPEVMQDWLEGGSNIKSVYKSLIREQLGNPVIFLDVDEVIQVHRAHLQGLMIDPVAVELIQRLCDLTGARIVYASVWGTFMNDGITASSIHEAFGFKGMSLMQTADGTEMPWRLESVTGSGNRGRSVQKYLADNPHIKNYVVIDDSWSDYMEILDKVVAPDGIEGFGVRDFYRAKDILVHGQVRSPEETRLPFIYPHRSQGCVRDMKTPLEIWQLEQQIKDKES